MHARGLPGAPSGRSPHTLSLEMQHGLNITRLHSASASPEATALHAAHTMARHSAHSPSSWLVEYMHGSPRRAASEHHHTHHDPLRAPSLTPHVTSHADVRYELTSAASPAGSKPGTSPYDPGADRPAASHPRYGYGSREHTPGLGVVPTPSPRREPTVCPSPPSAYTYPAAGQPQSPHGVRERTESKEREVVVMSPGAASPPAVGRAASPVRVTETTRRRVVTEAADGVVINVAEEEEREERRDVAIRVHGGGVGVDVDVESQSPDTWGAPRPLPRFRRPVPAPVIDAHVRGAHLSPPQSITRSWHANDSSPDAGGPSPVHMHPPHEHVATYRHPSPTPAQRTRGVVATPTLTTSRVLSCEREVTTPAPAEAPAAGGVAAAEYHEWRMQQHLLGTTPTPPAESAARPEAASSIARAVAQTRYARAGGSLVTAASTSPHPNGADAVPRPCVDVPTDHVASRTSPIATRMSEPRKPILTPPRTRVSQERVEAGPEPAATPTPPPPAPAQIFEPDHAAPGAAALSMTEPAVPFREPSPASVPEPDASASPETAVPSAEEPEPEGGSNVHSPAAGVPVDDVPSPAPPPAPATKNPPAKPDAAAVDDTSVLVVRRCEPNSPLGLRVSPSLRILDIRQPASSTVQPSMLNHLIKQANGTPVTSVNVLHEIWTQTKVGEEIRIAVVREPTSVFQVEKLSPAHTLGVRVDAKCKILSVTTDSPLARCSVALTDLVGRTVLSVDGIPVHSADQLRRLWTNVVPGRSTLAVTRVGRAASKKPTF